MNARDLESRIAASERAAFGTGVDERTVLDAEAVLGIQFPASYRWWLRRYGAGYLGGYELQGLAPVKPSERDPEEIYVGDVVCTALRNRADGTPGTLLEILDYEGDEVFFIDLSQSAGDEAPIVRRVVGATGLEQVAESFGAFLASEL